jgi:hypothetical protein
VAALDRVETASRARDQRSHLTAAKFRVLTGSQKSLLDQGLLTPCQSLHILHLPPNHGPHSS